MLIKDFRQWKKFALLLAALIFLSVIFYKSPFYYQARSYLIMSVYSKYEEKNSLLEKQKVLMQIPGGLSTAEKDWYPFVMVFNDDQGFSRYMGRELSLTVLYNFGSFQWKSDSSDYFQEHSPYYNSFYGGYLVKDNSGARYGFDEEGKLIINEIMTVPGYDYKHLVLESLGCPKNKLKLEVLDYKLLDDIQYIGYSGWSRIDADLLVNSSAHEFKGERRAYIQYGKPQISCVDEEFKPIATKGRIYVKYFEEYDCTIFLYIISPHLSTLEKCDQDILSKSTISSKE